MSVYDKSLEQIQSSYQFTDLEMAKMDYTLKVFTLPLYAQISLFVLSNLLLFFIGPVPSAKRKVMTKKQYTNKRFLSSLILLVYTILYFALQNVPHRSVVFWSIILQIIQLICAKLTRKGEIYEKD